MRVGPTRYEWHPIDPPVPLPPKPTGETRAGDLRYNIMVRLGNLGCPCPVHHLDNQALFEHWEIHLTGRTSGGRIEPATDPLAMSLWHMVSMAPPLTQPVVSLISGTC